MSSLKVICPKCYKGQQIVGDVPPAGLDHVCFFCKTTFRVRLPAHPSSPDLPVSRESAGKGNDLPAPREAVPKPIDLPISRDAAPKPGDLPISRDAVPRPDDLPVPRDAQPKPGDLPISRDAVPRPGDLPAPRDAVPRPGDLPVPRDAVPRPGDLPVPRDAVPRPGDLPVPRDAVPRPGDLPVSKAEPPVPSYPAMPPERSKTPPLGLALDLSFIPPPPDSGAPLGIEFPALPAQPEPLGAAAPEPAPNPVPEHRPVGPATRPPPLPPRASGSTPPPIPTSGRGAAIPGPSAGPTKPHAPVLTPLVPTQADAAPSNALLESLELDLGVPPAPLPTRARGDDASANKPSKAGLDLGFSLELERRDPAPSAAAPAAIPFPGARVANEGMAEAAAAVGEELPSLAPPTNRGGSAGRALRPVAKRARVPRWLFVVAGGVALAVLGVVFGLPMLRTAPAPDAVLKPMAAELGKDNLATYQKAAEQLIGAAADLKDSGAKLRLRAAELLLVGHAVHGGTSADLAKVEQLTDGAAGQPKLAPALGRVRALLAIAKGKPRDADGQLVDRAAPEAQWILGAARLAENQPAAAADALRKYLAVKPGDVVAHYLLGKALLGLGAPDARKEFEAVLAQNPRHLGAKVGLARLEETPEKRLTVGRELVEQKLPGGSFEQAELHLLIGQAAQSLGRTAEAMDAYQRAIGFNKSLIPASLALGECLLYEGKYKEALERLRAAGPGLEATVSGKFSLGGAQIANGRIDEGLAMIGAATKEKPDDPRGPFWQGFAASQKKPADPTATEQGYRDAIKRDPKFLPASLKLAAFLQQQDKAEDSLAVLRAAEEAGAPPSVLQLAWGEALIVAKEPAKAQAVFEKALENDPKSMAARLGIASALEAQSKLPEAKASLENTLKESPTTLGLRERLAQVALKMGDKAEALSRYQEEIKAGHATIALRLALGGLAIELGKIELAQSEAKKVLDESPRSAEAAYIMARVHEAHGEAGAALTEYRHATTWGSTPQYALSYARLLDKIGKTNEALTMYASAASLPEGRMERGRISFRAGDLESALADFQAASKMQPTDAEPLLFQGLCFDKMGQSAKAEEAWRAAIKVDADCPEPHYRLGRMELDRAKPSAAIEHFRKAAAKAPEDSPWRADLIFQLAQSELLTGSKAAALAEFKRYLEIAPPNAPARPEANEQVTRLGGGGKKKLAQTP